MAFGGDLEIEKCAFFLCDVQERFRPAILYFPEIVDSCQRLVKAAYLLQIPLVVTEQYPKGLGKTIPEIDVGGAVGVFEKTKFSMLIPEVETKLAEIGRKQIVLFGIETHVCIQQTAIDLLKKGGFTVFVVADATSSRSQANRIFALQRLRSAGAIITTYESVLLQLVADKNHEKFKEIQSIIKTLPGDSGLASSGLVTTAPSLL